jgi:N-acetylglucosamine-6-phosphate deacetylase
MKRFLGNWGIKMVYFLKADAFLLEKEERRGGYLTVQDGKFGPFVESVPENETILDFSGYTIAPGLFDTHIHGISGYDVMDGTVEALQSISSSIMALGVTRFLPTTLTSSNEDLSQTIQAIIEATKLGLPGAKAEGIFLEGPYFTEKHKGAQNPKYFQDPSFTEFQAWQNLAEQSVVKIAIAPERKGALDFIHKVTEAGVKVGIAHSDADFDTCVDAVGAGADIFIHLYNGMSGLHHRNPGIVGACFREKDTFAELICDGHHVHPEAANLAYKLKGKNLVLITDCMRAGQMPDGTYTLGEFPVVLKNGIARTESGNLAGSTLTLIDGVKNLWKWSRKPFHEIWHLASLSPARSLGRDHELGSIEQGKVADYVVLDSNWSVHAVAIDGEIKFKDE